jgi:hypothetical protein
VTTGGVIFIIKSAFLSPNEAESSSMNKPSPKATFAGIDEEKIKPRTITQKTEKPAVIN